MKQIIILFLFFLFSIVGNSLLGQEFPTLSGKGDPAIIQVNNTFILYEQMANPGTDSFTSQNFETMYDSFDSQGADDFIINGQGIFWTISSVEVLGVYYNGTGQANSVNVWFYNDSSGYPGSMASCEMNIIPTGGIATGEFVIPLTPYVTLPTGTYWLSVQCNMDFATGGQWGWMEQIPFNLGSSWRNPGGGWGTMCSNWGYRVIECQVGYGPYYDFSFLLNGVAIPVELESFTVDVREGKVELSWITFTETNNNGFEVEKNSGEDYKAITFVEGQGTTTETHEYFYIDKDVSMGSYSYRLKQIDFDGTYEYSNVVDVFVPAPDAFVLEQNYPNPFNPVTSIQFAIDSKPFISLKIYDVLGNEITTLINEEKPAGEYEVEFNAANLPSGIYFYQLKAGNYLETKKMILLK